MFYLSQIWFIYEDNFFGLIKSITGLLYIQKLPFRLIKLNPQILTIMWNFKQSDSQIQDKSELSVSKSNQQSKFYLPIKQKILAIKTIQTEQFIIPIATKQPKQFNHHIYGDKIHKILKKSSDSSRYMIQWQDKTRNIVPPKYLQKYHRQELRHFEMGQTFNTFLKTQNKAGGSETYCIVID